ncbi:MAG TPA: Na+/H+ antiporter subunit E [Noviherbaspirillum sp.]|jgi:multicomponent Na+:H+ antiporter subunit E|uniref:Na+/H+ antiporter subunit E n=1 Tax=Noviherbaspirillum sp. TaxID=1926288 RepID=UPI002DDCC1D9|nr:Na+/H+ antiporter subunit E [Noviherbaspirillum sp.]HEV2609478.1 Na+/H+ antiporter subunit E [Noviherbaspirillum sp.]
MLKSVVVRAGLLYLVWWIMSGGRSDAWLFGLVVVALAVVVSLRLQPRRAIAFSITGFLLFLIFFLGRSLKGGAQVAAIALMPRMSLHPAIVEVELRLPHETERIFLVSILSLLPGTLSAGLDKHRLLLHVLDSRLPVEEEVMNAEWQVARMFGVELR